ncbi:MAG: N-acetylglucosamine-6-phosphate deacetylase [Eubacteriales bacterium]
MIIKNIRVYGTDEQFHEGSVCISGERFAGGEEAKDSADQILDGKGCYAIPGLLDVHFHGCLGLDVCDGTEEAVHTIARYEAESGVTAICPATLTLPADELKAILANMADFRDRMERGEVPDGDRCADIVGINMEGPFISVVKKGAQNADYIIPCDAELAREFYEASGGLLKFIGLAPEDNPDFVGYINKVKEFTGVSLAHTNADYASAKKAFDAGARHAVHLFNAMSAFTHRDPGVVGAVSDSPHVSAEIITDGVHIHPAMVRTAFRFNGADRMIIISDSLRSTGMPDGDYVLGGQAIIKKGKYCRLAEGGALAGSVSDQFECMVNAVKEMEIPLETAVACSTIHPAKAIGVDDLYGTIEEGKYGDLVLLNEDLELMAVVKRGKVIVNKLR